MSPASIRSLKFGQAITAVPRFDKRALVPISVVVYCSIVAPFLMFIDSSDHLATLTPEGRYENRIFLPAFIAISIVLAVRSWSRLRLPPHIVCLFAYLAFAGTTVLWAFDPAVTFTRFSTQVMLVTSIVVPALLVDRTTDMMRGLFLAFAFGSALNFIIAVNSPPVINDQGVFYMGYFPDKNTLGEHASVAFLLACREMLYSGLRRVLGVVVIIISAVLVVLSNSKTSFALAVLSPILAAPVVLVGRRFRISPAIVLLPIAFVLIVLLNVPGNIFNRISYMAYGNYTFSARTLIWDFVNREIERKPLLGWGYRSFWGEPSGPSTVDGWGWVKGLPHAHNGYLDTMLEMGYVGYTFLLAFIFVTLHVARHLIDRDPVRAWLVLSLIFFAIATNFFESSWLRGENPVWVVFLLLVAELGRYWQPARGGDRSQYLPGRTVTRNRPPALHQR
jgi:O-antigen ligase